MASEALPAIRPQFTKLSPELRRPLAYTLTTIHNGGSHPKSDILVVFINGLGLPQIFWQATIGLVQQTAANRQLDRNIAITLLTYDRQGQGLSHPPGAPPPESHDLTSSVVELHHIIATFRPTSQARIFLVAHSIGVPLARLYIQDHPDTISSLLAIDSNMANSDFVSLFPDPDSPDFDPERDIPSDTSVEQLREAVERYRKMFHPSAPNPENLQRANLASLLPHADQPVLHGAYKDGLVKLSVIGHDPEVFAEESLKMSTKGLTRMYMEPVWQRYNQDLLKIGRSRIGKVITAEGAGHFVQRDRPDTVADEIWQLLRWLTE